ncbi:MAG TPA: hypothetical protein VGH56_03075 [Solirubrobacteraceae bacterium]
MEVCRSKWFIPLWSVALGLVVFGAMSIGGQVQWGLISLGILVAFGALVLIAGGRSETVRGLRGDGRDERFALMDMRADAVTGVVLTTAVIVAFLVEVAKGHSGAPYDWLGAIAGLAYLFSIVVLRVRG